MNNINGVSIPHQLPPEPPPEQSDPNEITSTNKKPIKEPDKPIPENFSCKKANTNETEKKITRNTELAGGIFI